MTLEDCHKLITAGRLQESLEALEAFLGAEPTNAAAWHLYAVALHRAGHSAESISAFDQAMDLGAAPATIFQNRAIALLAVGRVADAAESARQAVALRPDAVGGYVNLALAQGRLGQQAEAWETVSRGLEIAPEHVGLLNQATQIAVEAESLELAESFSERALALAPDHPEAIHNAGLLHQLRGRLDDALAAFDTTLAQQPGHQGAFVGRGLALRRLGRFDDALAHFRLGISRAPDLPALVHHHAVTELLVGNWTSALADFERSIPLAFPASAAVDPGMPAWDGEDISDRTLLVTSAAGAIETFQFLRFLPFAQARAGRVIFRCEPAICAILSRLNLFRTGGIALVANDAPLPEHDLQTSLPTLARLWGAAPDRLPRVTVRAALEGPRLQRWFKLGDDASKRWRVGLCWKPAPDMATKRDYAIPLSALAPLGPLSGRIAFIALQKHFAQGEVVPDGLALTVPPMDFDAHQDALVDTAALILSLDLVITSDTTIAHLAGVLGRPVWLLLETAPDWSWGTEGRLTDWYATMRLFRQPVPGDWTAVIEDVVRSLGQLVDHDADAEIGDSEAVRPRHGIGRMSATALTLVQAVDATPETAEAALTLALHAAAAEPAHMDRWSSLVSVLDHLGDAVGSRRALRFALDAAPDEPSSLVLLARKLIVDGQAEQAVAMLGALIGKTPGLPVAHATMASALLALGRYRPAEEAARRALDIDDRNAANWAQLGTIQAAAGRPGHAVDSWERAMAFDPGNAAAARGLAEAERSLGGAALGDWFARRAAPGQAPGDAAGQAGEDAPLDSEARYRDARDAYRAADYSRASNLFAGLLLVPELEAPSLNMLAAIALQQARYHRAVIFSHAAEAVGPVTADMLSNHAIGLRRIGEGDKAIEKLQSVIAQNPTAESHLTLANIYRDKSLFDPSLAHYRAALALKPDLAKIHRGIGNLMRDMHRPEEALEAFERARALSPKDSDLILDHAHAKLFAGDYVGGFRDYEARLQSRESKTRPFAEQRWKGEMAPGRVLLIHSEQGFGDNIQFARFIGEATRRVGRVVVEVRQPLLELMRNLETERPITVVTETAAAGKFDFHIPLMSLPLALETTRDTIPPPARFRLYPERIELWRQRLAADGMKVGLVWQGNPKARADVGRSPPLAVLAPLLSLPHIRFVALQKSDGLDQLRSLGSAEAIAVPGDTLGDFHETAHAMAALDAVVSSCTATLHLAASLGLPVYGMLKYAADWRWLNETDRSPWYPSLKLFRQPAPQDWQPVVAAIRAELARKVMSV